MVTIKKIMIRQLKKVTIVVIIILLLVFVALQITSEKKNVRIQAESMFSIIEPIILENDYEKRLIEDDLRHRQISATEIIAYMLEMNPEKKTDSLWLKDLAYLVDVDEILFYNDKGYVIGGTDHSYIGVSFDDGEQLSYFKPLLKNNYLKLAQEQIPRDFDGKEYRYAASWSNDDTYIIQVGSAGDKYEGITERFNLSYILKLLKSNTEVVFQIIDFKNDMVIASTRNEDLNKKLSDIGHQKKKLVQGIPYNFTMDGIKYYSVSTKTNNQYLVYSVPMEELYKNVLPSAVEIGILLCCIAYIIIASVVKYVDRQVIKNIQTVNENLSKIADGDLDIKVEINNSLEFNELSSFINSMVNGLKIKAEEREQIFTIVSQHSNKILYRYVLSEGRTYPWDAENAKKDVLSHLYKDEYSEKNVINNEYILPESLEDVKDFFVSIHSEVPSGETKIHLKHLDGENRWYHFKYTTLFENKKAHTALITIEDITEQHEYEIAYSRQLQKMENDIHDHLLVIESDLSEDRVNEIKGQYADRLEEIKYTTHNKLTELIRAEIFNVIDFNECINFFDIKTLQEIYRLGNRDINGEIKVSFVDKPCGWLRVSIQMIEDPYSNHIKAFTHFLDITEDKNREECIRQKAELDTMTGLLRKGVGQAKIEEIIEKNTESGGILIALDLDDLKGINDNLGHDEGDKAIIGIANVMKQHFRKNDILIRNGGDEFMVFLPGAAKAVHAVEQSMSLLLKELSEIYIGEEKERAIHCSGGCAVEMKGIDNFESLFKRADKALYHVKRNGKNNFAFYEPEMEQEDYEFRAKRMTVDEGEQLEPNDKENLIHMIMNVYRMVVLFNLSENTYTILKFKDKHGYTKMPKKGKIEEFLNEASKYIEEQEMPLFYKTLNRDYLLKKYHEGSETLGFKIRVKGKYSSQLMKSYVLFYKNERGDECAFNMLSK